MCIAILSTAHPGYPLILLSNRDEFLNRPTAPAEWWAAPNAHVLGGRDLQREEQGTWLAITKHGRLAVLTNFREEGVEISGGKSRGGIPKAFLTTSPEQHEAPREFARRLIDHVGVHDVGGFSLIFGELRAPAADGRRPPLCVLSNRSASADDLITIASGAGETHGLSNSLFGDTSWPKVVHGEQLLRDAIRDHVQRDESQESLIDTCFDILSVDTLPNRRLGETWEVFVRQLRNSIVIPPIDGEATAVMPADKLAAAAVHDEPSAAGRTAPCGSRSIYGTHQQTVILVDLHGKVTFIERTLYDANSQPLNDDARDRMFEFTIEGWQA